MSGEELQCLMSAIIFSGGKMSLEDACERANAIRVLHGSKDSASGQAGREHPFVSLELEKILSSPWLGIPYPAKKEIVTSQDIGMIYDHIRNNRKMGSSPMTVAEFCKIEKGEFKRIFGDKTEDILCVLKPYFSDHVPQF